MKKLMFAITLILISVTINGGSHAIAVVPKCYGNTCTNKGPVSQNCDHDGVRLASVKILMFSGEAKAELMYSPFCRAAWARGKSLYSAWDIHGADYKVRIVKQGSTSTFRSTATVQDDQGPVWDWTQMAGLGNGKVKACVEWRGDWKCTNWFAH